MSIYDVFNGGSKPFDKAEWAAQKHDFWQMILKLAQEAK